MLLAVRNKREVIATAHIDCEYTEPDKRRARSVLDNLLAMAAGSSEHQHQSVEIRSITPHIAINEEQ